VLGCCCLVLLMGKTFRRLRQHQVLSDSRTAVIKKLFTTLKHFRNEGSIPFARSTSEFATGSDKTGQSPPFTGLS